MRILQRLALNVDPGRNLIIPETFHLSLIDRECCEFPFVYKNAQCIYKCGIGRLAVRS